MAELSNAGFGKFLLIFLLIILAIRLIFKFFGPHIMRYIIRRISKKAEQQFSQRAPDSDSPNRAEKTTIDYNSPNSRESNNDTGEYIDYEEID